MAPREAFYAAMRRFRARRMRRFAAEFGISAATRVLDVGGTPLNWLLLATRPRVVLLNMPRAREPVPPGFESVFADARSLPFGDQSFDIVFSNSVIEHVGDFAEQRRFAGEIQRVGRRYWVQTPNRGFPVEPHLLTPFLHWLPRAWQRRIATRGTVWELIERPSPDRRRFYIDHYLNDIRLLGLEEMGRLFPGACLVRERCGGLTKSIVAYRRQPVS